MNTNATHLPDASDIGLDILIFRRASPLWMVYDAMLAGEKVLAWRFLPVHVRGSQDGSKLWPLLPDWAVAGDLSAGQMGIAPRMAAFSYSSNSGWLVYPATPLAVDKPINDRKKLADLANHLLTALDQLHSRKTLHLDVHPNNVRDNKGQFCLVGLGADVRKQAGAATASNEGLARKGYGAPEMWDASGRSKLGPWTDIFAAAATIYYAICGKAPADFRERIDKTRWREAIAYDLNRELSKSGTAWPKMVEFIIAGLAPKIEDRPTTVSEWSRIWKEPVQDTSAAVSAVEAASSLPSTKTGTPPNMFWNTGFWLCGLLASWTALVLFNAFLMPLVWMEAYLDFPLLLPASSSYSPMLCALIYQIMALLVVDNALASANRYLRSGVLWAAVITMFASTWYLWGGNVGWVDWFNAAACFVLLLSLSSRYEEGRDHFLKLGPILISITGFLSYFYIQNFDGLTLWFENIVS